VRLGRILRDGVVVPVRFEGDHFVPVVSLLDPRDAGAPAPLSRAAVLAPVVPGKIVCVGRNYRAHAKELGHEVPTEPLLFLKPPSAVIGPGEVIVLPPESARVEHEGELAVVIGRRLRRASLDEVRAGIAGYTCANDVTARDLQKRDVQFTRAKGFDTFCPLGPWVVTERPPPEATIAVRVNGAPRQRGQLRDMVFGIDELVAYASNVMTLEPGDVVLTGTPEGVGPLAPGDTVEVEIEGVGTLTNTVRAGAIASLRAGAHNPHSNEKGGGAMTDPKDEKGAGEELKEGLMHLFSAARKVMKSAEPAINKSLDDAERVISKLGRGGEAVAAEVGKEVASLATRLADKIKAVADRAEGNVPDERTPPEPPPS
jgi:2-keto-4-pentenoate hydratase/2-oxohepta-3-ene-1,7-dioic acid hydratase in catechol pathway